MFMSEDMKILLSKFDELKADITELKTDVNGQIADLRVEVNDLRTDVADFKTDVYGQIHELREELGGLKEETKKTRLILEQDISLRMDVRKLQERVDQIA